MECAYNKFVTGTEDHFRRTLGPQGADVLVRVLANGVKQAAKIDAENGFTEARTTPTVAYDLCKTALNIEFESTPGVRFVCKNHQNIWVFDEIYALRVKKLDSQFRPTNHESAQQAAISAQQPLDDDLGELIHVTAGPRFSVTTGLVIDYVVVKHVPSPTNKHQAEWIVDLEELAGGQMVPLAPILPIAPPAPVVPAAILRRSRSRTTGATGE